MGVLGCLANTSGTYVDGGVIKPIELPILAARLKDHLEFDEQCALGQY